jgi:hypothetical protein
MMCRRAFSILVCIAGSLATLACDRGPTEACPSASITPTRWLYSAVQVAPARMTVEGVLTISSVRCGDFTGSIDMLATDALGQQRRLAGPVNGRAVSATAIRFDVEADGGVVQHVGVLSADSMRGSWVSLSGSTSTSGTFSGTRQSAP